MGQSEAAKNRRRPDEKLADYIPRLAGTPLEFQPGSRWMYSASAGLVKNENSLSMSSKVYFAGGGGLVSTVDDYSHFAQMLANGGEWNGKRLLSPRTVKLMGSAHIRSTLPGCGGNHRISDGRYRRGDAGDREVGGADARIVQLAAKFYF